MTIVSAVNDGCLKCAQDNESKAFFYKMIGDYYRYVAESAPADTIDQVKNGALQGYT